MHNRLKRLNTINMQLMISYSSLLVLMVTGIVAAVAILFSEYFISQKIDVTRSSMEFISNSIENRMDDIRKVTQLIRQNSEITESVKSGALSESAEAALRRIYLYGMRSVMFVTPDRKVLNPAFVEVDYNRMLEYTGYDAFSEVNREEQFSSPHSYPYYNGDNTNYMTRINYYFRMRDKPSLIPYGTIVITIEKDSLFQDRTEFAGKQLDYFYIIDGNGNVVYSNNGYDKSEPVLEHVIAMCSSNYSTTVDRTASNTYFHSNIPSYPDWHLVGVLSTQTLYESASNLVGFIILVGIVGIAIVILLSFFISRRISNPILKLCAAMHIFDEGTIPAKVDISGQTNEILTLEHGFNKMIDSIEANIQTICQEQDERKLAEIAALRYQLLSLQQQINPHFLYNTLNVINYLAVEGSVDKIQGFLQSLTRLLRATLSNTHEEILLMEEFSILKAYAHLMEYRYKDLFELSIEADEQALICMLPKLLLQPLVENSLFHGMLPGGQKIAISVVAVCAEGLLNVSISDNGQGIAEDMLDNLLKQEKKFNSIGLKNINDRLILCYGDASGLQIESKYGFGTTVRFSLPAKMEE